MRSPRRHYCPIPVAARQRPPAGCTGVADRRTGSICDHRTASADSSAAPSDRTVSRPRRHGRPRSAHRISVLLYSDDSDHPRRGPASAVGPPPGARPRGASAGVECATEPAVIEAVETPARSTSLVLDGEAAPAGGLGICRQLKNEIYRLPAGPGAHRPPAGRLARDLVAGRPGRAAPARPDRPRRAPWPTLRPPRSAAVGARVR